MTGRSSEWEQELRRRLRVGTSAARETDIIEELAQDLEQRFDDLRSRGVPEHAAWAEVLALPGTHLHLYGKRDAKRGRKMGHLNITSDSADAARATALKAAALLGIAPF